jgi:glycosyltransferase involved in cell wall biosynthesis
LPVIVVPLATQLPTDQVVFSREGLNLPANAFVVGCAGLITPEKRLDLVLYAFARLLQQVPHARLLVVGEIPAWYPSDLSSLIAQLGLSEAVTCTGYVGSMREFDQYLSIFDAGVNLRRPTSGETSASALRMMAQGCPVIVSNTGWYAELPDDACLKIDHGPDEIAILAQHLIDLATDQTRRELIGQRARGYVETTCNPERVARAYIDFAQQVIEGVCHYTRGESHV